MYENSKDSVTMEVIGNFRESSFWDPSGGRSQAEMSRRMSCGSGDNSSEPFSQRGKVASEMKEGTGLRQQGVFQAERDLALCKCWWEGSHGGRN